MRTFYCVLIIFVLSLEVQGQITPRKERVYSLPAWVRLGNGEVTRLKSIRKVAYKQLSNLEKNAIHQEFPYQDTLEYFEEIEISGKTQTLLRKVIIDSAFYEKQSLPRLYHIYPNLSPLEEPKMIPAQEDSTEINRYGRQAGLKTQGYVKAIGNRLSLYPQNQSYNSDSEYFYELSKQERLVLRFKEYDFSLVYLPLRYRFSYTNQKDSATVEVSGDFGVNFNVNLFLSYTLYGQSSFSLLNSNQVGIRTQKLSLGVLIGSSLIQLNRENTSQGDNPLPASESILKGTLSLGAGLNYTYNNWNIGIFAGFDFSLGDFGKNWNYNRRPWLGLGFGIPLLQLN